MTNSIYSCRIVKAETLSIRLVYIVACANYVCIHMIENVT